MLIKKTDKFKNKLNFRMNMVTISLEEALASFGLSSKEIRIYLACLELGTSTANEIANKSQLNRSTTYDLLKTLIEKGIVSKTVRKKTTHFEVISPEKLISQLEEKKQKLSSVLDQLKLIEKNVVRKPKVVVYEGAAGVKNIFEDILNSKQQTDVISTSKIFEVFTYYFPHYIQKRAELKIPARVIQEASKQTTELKKRDKLEHRKTRALETKFNSSTYIYGDKVAIIKLNKDDLIGVLIADKTIADDQRNIFEILWSKAK